MRRAFVVLLSALLLSNAIITARAQGPSDSNEGSRLIWDNTNSIYRFSWWGRSGRTYFIQHSDDLTQWIYVPVIEPGTDAVKEWGFTSTGGKFFLRLKISDQTATDPNSADFDGDGVSNYDELLQGTDPLSSVDSDNDGLPDDWETRFGLNPFDPADATADIDGDGRTSLQEFHDRSDPTDYYNGAPPTVTIAFGNNQQSTPAAILGTPFIVQVTNSAGTPLVSAPLHFAVESGGGSLFKTRQTASLGSSFDTRTDASGYATAYYMQPPTLGQSSTVTATASSGQNVVAVSFSTLTVGVPSNDGFANAVTISGNNGSLAGSNGGATLEANEPIHANSLPGASVWYAWQAPSTGDFAFSVASTSFDPICAIYAGSSLASLTPIAGNDDDENAPVATSNSRVAFRAVQGTIYHIAVDGFDAATGAFQLGWSIANGPANDHFAAAQNISGASGSVQSSNVNATLEPSEPTHARQVGGKSVWFRWIPSSNGRVEFSTANSTFDTLLAVYTGTALANLSEITFNNDETPEQITTSKVSFPVTAGTIYYVAVAGMSASTGSISLSWSLVSPPSNDNFANSQALAGNNGNVSGTNILASKEADEPYHADNPGGTSVWYTWTAASGGSLTVTTLGSTFDTVCAVYTGTGLAELVAVASNDDPNSQSSTVTFPVQPGTTYHIAIDGNDGVSGQIALNWNLTPPPANDAFAAAELISGDSGSLSASNLFASKESGEPDHAGNQGGGSIWYQWQTTTSASQTFTTQGSDFDTVMAVYTGSAVDNLALVTSNDDSDGGLTSSVTFMAQPGVTYLIAVDGYGGSRGNVVLNWGNAGGFAPQSFAFANPEEHQPKPRPSKPPMLPGNQDSVPVGGMAFAAMASEEECAEGPPEANRGEAGHNEWVQDENGDWQQVFSTSRTIYLGLPEQPPPPRPAVSPCPESISVQHKIVTVNTPRARDLPGKLRLTVKSGDVTTVEIKHSGAAYTFGTDISVLETGHSGCGVHTWHFGEESFEFTPKKKGSLVLEAEVDPDPDDGGDGVPTQKLTITIVCLDVKYTAKPGGALPYPISAKTQWNQQEAPTRTQRIQVVTDPPEYADQITLKVKELDPNENPAYQPVGLGSIQKETSGQAQWLYEAFEEPDAKADKHPKTKKVNILPYIGDQELCVPFVSEVRSVFEWLVLGGHAHGPDATETHYQPTDADYGKALAYVKWKYGVNTGNISFGFARTGPHAAENGFTFMYGGPFDTLETSRPRTVNIYRGAFSSENNAASTLGHENVHGGQKALGNIDRRRPAKVYKLIENPAWQWELDNADANGLSDDEKATVRTGVERTSQGLPPTND